MSTVVPKSAFEMALDEGRLVIGRQIDNLGELNQKASQMMTLAITIDGAIIAAVGVFLSQPDARQLLVPLGNTGALGLSLILLAVALMTFVLEDAVAAYVGSRAAVGLRAQDLEQVVLGRMERAEFTSAAIVAYAMGIEENEATNVQMASRMKRTLTFFVAGVACVSAGAMALFVRIAGW